MNSNAPIKKRNHPFRKLWHWIVLILAIILIAGLYIYINFNNLLAEALQKSFNSSLISNVYELKFEKLRVNPIVGNINVINVAFHKREKPLHYYPYINSTIKLTTHKILLTKVNIISLLQSNVLQLESIEIDSPEVELVITDAIPIFFPFKDSTNLVKEDSAAKKKSIEGFILKEFKLINAGLTVLNSAKERELKIENLNISVKDFLIQQLPGQDIIASNSIDLSLGGLSGKLKREGFKTVNFQNFQLNIDTIKVEKTIDTLIYQFSDFNTGVEMLDLLTADSIFEIKMQSFQLSYKGKSIDLQGVSFTPTVKNELIPTKSKYRQTQFSGSLGSLKMSGVNFDTLSLAQKLFIEKISLDSIDLNLFVDKAKMIDPKKFPEYLGQKIISIPLPIEVKYVEAKAVNLVNTEKKENGEYAKIHVQHGTLEAQNITNLPTTEPLSLTLSAYIEG
ncbi:MAG: hypothetical protein Q8T08_07555, partial [Ignavibacteria bacterium]|nr:hypothetical protein [Ignavibacteria bacterium]